MTSPIIIAIIYIALGMLLLVFGAAFADFIISKMRKINKSKDSKFKDIPPNKIKKQANSKKSIDDVLNMSLSEIYAAIVDLQKDSDDEKFLQILKLLYTIYNNPDIDNLSKLKAAKRLDFICTHLGYYSTKTLYDTIKERNESNEKGE